MPTWDEWLVSATPRGLRGKAGDIPRARWMESHELTGDKWAHKRTGIFLGYRDGRPVAFNDNRHVVTVAGSRAGKGRSLIIPNLYVYEGSALVIDPKGELARETAHIRAAKAGHRVVVLDPFGRSGVTSGAFNPLDGIDPLDAGGIDVAATIAAGLIRPLSKGDLFWSQMARQLVQVLVMFVSTFDAKERNLTTVRDLVTFADVGVREHAALKGCKADEALLELMSVATLSSEDGLSQLPAFGVFTPLINGLAHGLRAMDEKTRAGVFADARAQTGWLDSRQVASVLSHSDFALADLKAYMRDPSAPRLTVYLCLPAAMMDSHGAWFRMMINRAFDAFEETPTNADVPPVLVVLEEFGTAIGYMERIEAAAGLIAGSGVKLWTVLQDLTQLQKHYDKSWETFIGNAGVVTCFGTSDPTTLKYITERLGTVATITEKPSGASQEQLLRGGRYTTEDLKEPPLAAPHELQALLHRDALSVLVLAAGEPPLMLQRALYDLDAGFKKIREAVARKSPT